LLAFHHASVAGQEATLLEHRAQGRLEVVQRLGDAVTNGTGLAAEAAASNGDGNVVLVETISGDDRLLHDQLQHGASEIALELAAVDSDLALARLDPDAGNGVLALAGGIGAAEGVELLLMHGGSVGGSGRSNGAEVLEGVDGVGHVTSPAR